MKTSLSILYWIPRILGIVFIIFISLFALDVFFEGYSFWETILAFLIHLVPTYILIISLLIAWKWELPGGVIFIVLGLTYIIMFPNHPLAYAIISGPSFLIGLMFLLSGFLQKRRKSA